MEKEKINRLIQFICYMLSSLFFIFGVILWYKLKTPEYAKLSWLLTSSCIIFLGVYIIINGFYFHLHWYSKKWCFFYSLLYIFSGIHFAYKVIFMN